ncbi:MAG: P-II family nitrogen regulator [Planctomycetaceae bacterium]|nr:P-II family nitrogen regulator [Planctomycetaceae bacterium]
MKLLYAIIRPTKLEAVREALKGIGVERLSVCDAHGYGRQRGHTETYRGMEYSMTLIRKVVLEIVVNDDYVDRTMEVIERVGRAGTEGNIGDGKIFQLPVEEVIRIGDTVRGKEAV